MIPAVYRVREVAVLLDISEPTVRRLIKDGTLPTVKGMPSPVRVPRAAVERLLVGEAAA